jgi:hypothetical protein
MGNSNADSDSNWTESDASDSEFEMDPKEKAELKALEDAMLEEQTVRDRKTADRFYKIIEKTNTPSKWETVVRYPRLDGKNYMEHDRKNPPKVNLWKPGHELKKHKDEFFWACFYIRADPRPEMYMHHSMRVHRDGRLVGTMVGGLGGWMIDVQEINRSLDAWSEELKTDGNKYWDEVEG